MVLIFWPSVGVLMVTVGAVVSGGALLTCTEVAAVVTLLPTLSTAEAVSL